MRIWTRIGQIVNPSFPVTVEQAQRERERMMADPRPLPRPVVVIAGWRSPRVSAMVAARELCSLTSGRSGDFLSVSYAWLGDIGLARREVELRVEAFASPHGANEVDAVGISMGGLVARTLGARVVRLFTLATPHRGARLARWVRPDSAARAMKPGSAFLRELDAGRDGPREMVCYTHLRDWWVGSANTAPPGREPIWCDTRNSPDTLLSHFTVSSDVRILVDIARRLRGEMPLGGEGEPPPI
ncbi:MAG: hypothetical protein SFZ23_13995 [Planctomycetota bacterium]|nr:hypothetical protein [Planctomycetota bacterium]